MREQSRQTHALECLPDERNRGRKTMDKIARSMVNNSGINPPEDDGYGPRAGLCLEPQKLPDAPSLSRAAGTYHLPDGGWSAGSPTAFSRHSSQLVGDYARLLSSLSGKQGFIDAESLPCSPSVCSPGHVCEPLFCAPKPPGL